MIFEKSAVVVFITNFRVSSDISLGLPDLDLSNNPLLLTLYTHINPMSTLDVSKNPLLSTLGCSSNNRHDNLQPYKTSQKQQSL